MNTGTRLLLVIVAETTRICSAVKPRYSRKRDWRARSRKFCGDCGPKRLARTARARARQSWASGQRLGNRLGVNAAFRQFGADSNGSLAPADTGGDEGVREPGVVGEALPGEAGRGPSSISSGPKSRAASFSRSSARECSRRASRSIAVARAVFGAGVRLIVLSHGSARHWMLPVGATSQ